MSASRRRPTHAEVEGFLAGVEHQLHATQTPDPEAARLVEEGRAALKGGDRDGAERLLIAAADRLRGLRTEPPLREWPRGLVGYVPTAPELGVPDADEDPLTNRLRLVERLWAVSRSRGIPVDDLLPTLSEAARRRAAGDVRGARQLIDQVHAELDRRAGSPARPPG